MQARWHALAGQGALTVPFLLPSRLGFLDVRLAGSAGGERGREQVRRLRLSAHLQRLREMGYDLADLRLVPHSAARDDAPAARP